MKAPAAWRVALACALFASVLAGAPSRAEAPAAPERSRPRSRAPSERARARPLGEPMNRGIFAFNDGLDRYFLEPVAIGWDFVVPEPVERGDREFLRERRDAAPGRRTICSRPSRQGGRRPRPLRDQHHIRDAGLFDPAGAKGIARRDEDFGQTLGVWGVPAGPYLVLPFFGPSSPRDAAGSRSIRCSRRSSTSLRGT